MSSRPNDILLCLAKNFSVVIFYIKVGFQPFEIEQLKGLGILFIVGDYLHCLHLFVHQCDSLIFYSECFLVDCFCTRQYVVCKVAILKVFGIDPHIEIGA